MPKDEDYLTVKETAEFLGVAPNTIRNWGTAGQIPEHRHPINNYRLFKMSDLAKLKRRMSAPSRK